MPGRDPRPEFAAECRTILGAALAPLGFAPGPAAEDSVRFERRAPDEPDGRVVEVSWDPYDVRLSATVDGVDLARALYAARMPSEALERGSRRSARWRGRSPRCSRTPAPARRWPGPAPRWRSCGTAPSPT